VLRAAERQAAWRRAMPRTQGADFGRLQHAPHQHHHPEPGQAAAGPW